MTNPLLIAVVGAGQLGSRHLQGMARLTIPCEFHIIDPSEASLVLARQRFDEVARDSGHTLHLHRDASTLPPTLDHLVVATTADVRLAAMRAVLEGRSVRHALLEKVLFQRVHDLDEAQTLLMQAGTVTWVNCPRRLFPIHVRLREFFAADPLQHLDVRGGNWGLGCNSIHFIDLIAFLTGRDDVEVDTRRLDPALLASKRAGFSEFSGTLSGRCGSASFDLTSLREAGAPLLLSMRAGRRSAIVDESAGRAFLHDPDGAGWETVEARSPLMSEMAAGITAAILAGDGCALTPYARSAAYHRPLLKALIAHHSEATGRRDDRCPIT